MLRGRRRGSVTLLAIAVLALLFVIASALLMVSSQQRQAAEQAAKARELRAINDALTQNVLVQLRRDVVGNNGSPYDGN